ncbi:MAG: DeoR/GlpR family DNA-binding transcription regulator [Lachnospiraceae bacterium]|nr:DeoR/GlpR family DNA-binding transcription regulator [Lachnospiraceae bacterium]
MLYTERVEFIIQQLQLCANAKVGELAEAMHVSLDTVRRDLKTMEREGLVKYVRGGACLPETLDSISHFSGREIVNIPQKRQSAVKALEFIQPGSVIALNSGTTNMVLAQEIVKRFSDLTIVTNNLAAATVLLQNSSIHTVLIGGDVDVMERSTYGHFCEKEFSSYHPDCAFLSINAVNDLVGYSDFRFSEIGIMQTLAANSRRTVAVMDSSKLGKQSKKLLFPLSSIDVLVLNDITEEQKAQYIAAGAKIE